MDPPENRRPCTRGHADINVGRHGLVLAVFGGR